MVAWQFVQPWLSKLKDDPSTASEFANLRTYLARIDSGDLPLFNPHLQNATVDLLTATLAGNLAAGGFKVTGLGAGTANGDSIRFQQLKIIQVVSGSSTTNFSTTSASFVNTNLSASITPSSVSNSILAMAVIQVIGVTNGTSGVTQISDGTNTSGIYVVTNNTAASNGRYWIPMVWVDSPATTSALTFRVQAEISGAPVSVSFGDISQQSIVLMEVAP